MVRNEELKFEGNDILQLYAKELVEDVKISNVNLREKSLTTSSIRAKWLNYLFTEQHNLKRAKEYKETILKSKTSNPKNTTSILPMKNEDIIANGDERISKLNKLIETTKENINYLENVLNILNDLGFTIKNAIEAQKLFQGS